ncbi:hypothetical protein ACR0ST_04480 [Aliidiomarina sp. Khilg15.8]
MSSILLARPHPFIVSEMAPFLQEAGYAVSKLTNSKDLPQFAKTHDAAVISTALVSSISDTAEEIIQQLRQAKPRMPLILAGLLSADQAERGIKKLMKPYAEAVTIYTTQSQSGDARLGQPQSVIYLNKDDFTDASRRAQLMKLFKAHI